MTECVCLGLIRSGFWEEYDIKLRENSELLYYNSAVSFDCVIMWQFSGQALEVGGRRRRMV